MKIYDINIKSKDASKQIQLFRKKIYFYTDVRFLNTHMKKINKLIETELFVKNDLFISAETLFDAMHPVGGKGKHHYHGLYPEDILDSLKSIKSPYAIIKDEINSRYLVITTFISHFGKQLFVIIEIGSGTVLDSEANINKIVTIYPRANVDDFINKKEEKNVFYLSKNKK